MKTKFSYRISYALILISSFFFSCSAPTRIFIPSNLAHKEMAIKTAYSYTSNTFDLGMLEISDPFQYWYVPEVTLYFKYDNFFFSGGFPPLGPFGVGYTFYRNDNYQTNLITQASLSSVPACMIDCLDLGYASAGTEARKRISKEIWIGLGLFTDYKHIEYESTLSIQINEENNRSLSGNRKTDSITTISVDDHYKRIKLFELSTPFFIEFNLNQWNIITTVEFNYPIYYNGLVDFYEIEENSIINEKFITSNTEAYFDFYINISKGF